MSNLQLSHNPIIRDAQLKPVNINCIMKPESSTGTMKTARDMTDQERRARISKLRKYIINLQKVHDRSYMHNANLESFSSELEVLLNHKSPTID